MKKTIQAFFAKKLQGQALVELLLVIGIAAIFLPGLLTALVASREGQAQQDQRVEAVALMRETEEVVRSVREKGWNAFATNGTFHPAISGSAWSFAPGSEVINGLTRQLVISDVYRDSNGVVVQSGGTKDSSTKKVTITVSWIQPRIASVTSAMYVTRYVQNVANRETSVADFNDGTKSNVTVGSANGGEIQLAANTKGKWCEPVLSSVTIDLPQQPNAVSATEGHVYAASANTSGSFAHVLVSNSDPPSFTLHGKLTGYSARAVFGDPDYGYIATTNDSKEIVIVNLNQYSDTPNKIYAESGSFNSSGSTNGDAIFVLDNRGYMTAGAYLYVFDLSSKTGSRSQIGNRIQFANSGDKANEIYVRKIGSSTYAFVAIEGSTVDELKVINVTNHNQSSQWRVEGVINIEPNNCSSLESGRAVFVKPDGSRAYVSSVNDATFKEFFVINTSNKNSPSLVGGFATNPPCTNGGGYEANGMNPEQSVIVSLLENRALLVGTSGEEYQVLDLTNEASPTRCGGLEFNQGIYGVAAVKETDGDAFAYIITGDSGSDLKVIQGGPDGNYVESGTYESSTFDFGQEVALNRIAPTVNLPGSTDVTFQVAAAHAVNGSCTDASFTYVGPDGTGNTYFPSSGGPIPLSEDGSGFENPARCVRYKAFLTTTNYSNTPSVYEVTINYSP